MLPFSSAARCSRTPSPASIDGGAGVSPNSARAARISASPAGRRPWSARAAPCTACSVYADSGGRVSQVLRASSHRAAAAAGSPDHQVGVRQHPHRSRRPGRRVPTAAGGGGHGTFGHRHHARIVAAHRSERGEHGQALDLQVAEVVGLAPAPGRARVRAVARSTSVPSGLPNSAAPRLTCSRASHLRGYGLAVRQGGERLADEAEAGGEELGAGAQRVEAGIGYRWPGAACTPQFGGGSGQRPGVQMRDRRQ